MRWVMAGLGVLLLACIGTAVQAGKNSEKRPQYIVHLALAEAVEGGQPKHLAEPTLAVLEGIPAVFQSMGSVSVGDEPLEFGTGATIRLTSRRGRKVTICGKVEVSQLVSSTSDTAVRECTTLCFQRSIPLNATVRIELLRSTGTRHWCDVTVEKNE